MLPPSTIASPQSPARPIKRNADGVVPALEHICGGTHAAPPRPTFTGDYRVVERYANAKNEGNEGPRVARVSGLHVSGLQAGVSPA